MRSIKTITKQLEAKKLRLAKLRDELRELEGELNQYAENAEDAWSALEECVQTLSEYV